MITLLFSLIILCPNTQHTIQENWNAYSDMAIHMQTTVDLVTFYSMLDTWEKDYNNLNCPNTQSLINSFVAVVQQTKEVLRTTFIIQNFPTLSRFYYANLNPQLEIVGEKMQILKTFLP